MTPHPAPARGPDPVTRWRAALDAVTVRAEDLDALHHTLTGTQQARPSERVWRPADIEAVYRHALTRAGRLARWLHRRRLDRGAGSWRS